MKKLALTLAVAALSLSTAAFAADVQGAEGQIKFIGQVTEAGCVIDSGANATIQLGSMPKNVLNQRGFSSWTEGQLKFIDCNLGAEDGEYITGGDGYVQSVEITIKPGMEFADGNADVWKNSGGSAQGVGVEVMIAGDEPGVLIPVTGTTAPIKAKIDQVNHVAIYTVAGRMVAPGEEATAGSVATTLTFVASYK